MKNTLLLGAHISISESKDKAFARAESIGCTAMQIFTKSNRQWNSKPITFQEAESFKLAHQKSFVKSAIVHAMYLINLGSINKEIRKKSLDALCDELVRCNQLGLKYLVLHPGSAQGSSVEDSIKLIAEGINYAFLKEKNDVVILLENMAGQGSSIGHKFEQLAAIRQNIEDTKRIGFCFDFCHAFASGYVFGVKDLYEAMWKEFDGILGISNLKVIHINDSKKPLGSRVDRHENIGRGQIGLEAFRLLFNDPRFFNTPKILETPIEGDEKGFIPDLKVIVNLISGENYALLEENPLNVYKNSI